VKHPAQSLFLCVRVRVCNVIHMLLTHTQYMTQAYRSSLIPKPMPKLLTL